MTIGEAANVLGVPIEEARRLQKDGYLPDPIPDDYLDAVMRFRIRIEKAHRAKMDAFSRAGRDD